MSEATTRRRWAQEYVERCRADVQTTAGLMRWPRCDPGLDLALHRSVSTLLLEQVRRLQDDRVNIALPQGLLGLIRQADSKCTDRDLSSVVRLRARQWCVCIKEMLGRLEHDWNMIVSTFSFNPTAVLVDVSSPLGDPHRGGQSVYKLSFDKGESLIYKPRPVVTEHVFGKLVKWLNEHGQEPALACCEVLPCHQYGWTNYIRSAFCRTQAEVETYFERQGAFLALFYLTCSSDCHWENVVVNCDNPVWIDTECLCGPIIPRLSDRKVPIWMRESVLATTLIYRGNEAGLSPFELTGLSASVTEEQSKVRDDAGRLRPGLIAKIVTGFRNAYHLVLEKKGSWVSASGPLSWLDSLEVRVLPRPTAVYAALENFILMSPEACRTINTEKVAQYLATAGGDAWPVELVRTEVRALCLGDIPYWSVSTSSSHLHEADGTVVPSLIQRRGMDRLAARTARLGDKDCDDQVWLIDAYLRLRR